MNSISVKRSITVKAVVTPSWKEEAERELSNAISAIDQQLGELEKEGQSSEPSFFQEIRIRRTKKKSSFTAISGS